MNNKQKFTSCFWQALNELLIVVCTASFVKIGACELALAEMEKVHVSEEASAYFQVTNPDEPQEETVSVVNDTSDEQEMHEEPKKEITLREIVAMAELVTKSARTFATKLNGDLGDPALDGLPCHFRPRVSCPG